MRGHVGLLPLPACAEEAGTRAGNPLPLSEHVLETLYYPEADGNEKVLHRLQ